MKPGLLRHLVTLDEPAGEAGFTPLDPPTWYCGLISEGSGQAVFLGRFHPGISTATRVHFKGRVYHVDTLDNREERDRELALSCREVFD
jgi:Phage head-tail joining protein